MKFLFFTVLVSGQVMAADWSSTMQVLQNSGMAKSHYEPVKFHYTNNNQAPSDATVQAYQELARQQAALNQAQQRQVYCYFDSYGNRICN